MPRIAAVATATPKHLITQEDAKAFARAHYGDNRLFDKLLPVFDNANVRERHFAVSLDWFAHPHSFTEVNDLYIQTALDLSEKVTLDVAERAGIRTTDFDAVFFVSTTGLSTPSIDARLFNRIALNPHFKRIPIWGLGCAGGVAGMTRAMDYLKAYPSHRALVIAVELCGLSFHGEEVTKENIISAALFGDGAAACAVFGDKVALPEDGLPHPSVVGGLSTIYPDSLEVMSWRITSDGFKVQLSRDIPSIVTSLVKGNIEEMLRAHELRLDQVRHFVMHPGGMKVLQAYSDGLGIPMDRLEHSTAVLGDFGNMSSVTVYFVLKRFLESTRSGSSEYGLMGALGPGFSSELALLHWD